MGLRFRISLQVLWLTSKLCTRAYSIAEIDAGLAAWRRLLEARGAQISRGRSNVLRTAASGEIDDAWLKVREAYLDIMVEAGCSAESVQARLDALDAERSQRREQQFGKCAFQRFEQVRSSCAKSRRSTLARCRIRGDKHGMCGECGRLTQSVDNLLN